MNNGQKSITELYDLIFVYLELNDYCALRLVCKGLIQTVEQYAMMIMNTGKYNWISPTFETNCHTKALCRCTRNVIMIVGGNLDNRRCSIFDPNVERFSSSNICSLTYKRIQNFTLSWNRGRLFAISGLFPPSLGSVEVYDPIQNKWKEYVRLPCDIDSSSAISADDVLYVTGGYDHISRKPSNRIFCLHQNFSNKYHQLTNKIDFNHDNIFENEQSFWQELNIRLLTGRSHHSTAYFDHCIWIAGGINMPYCSSNFVDDGSIIEENRVFRRGCLASNSVEIFDIKNNFIKNGPAMLHNRYQNKIVVSNKELYVVGGDMEGAEYITQSIEHYNQKNGKWELVTNFPIERLNCAVAVNGSIIYLFGGTNSEGDLIMDWDGYNTVTGVWLSSMDDTTILTPIDIDNR